MEVHRTLFCPVMTPRVLKLFSKMALSDEMWAPAYLATKAYAGTFFKG